MQDLEDKKSKLVYSNNGISYYLYTPSFFRLYWKLDTNNNGPEFRNTISHKIHQVIYLLLGGYNILYAVENNKVLGYLIYTRSNDLIVENTTKQDLYSIYIWTYPESRNKGVAQSLLKVLLNDLNLDYNFSYKAIKNDNIQSITAAKRVGYEEVYDIKKDGILKTNRKVSNGEWKLYRIKRK